MAYGQQKGDGMTKFFGKTCVINRSMIAAFLTILVTSGSVSIWLVQSRLVRNAFTIGTIKDSSTVTVHFIDVGQGDSILIDALNKDVLIDGGPTSAGPTVLNYLGSAGVTHVQLMIATHVHEDHIGGLVAVLSSATIVDEVIMNGQTSTSNVYTNFMNLAQSHTVTVAERGRTYILTQTANLTVLNPVQPLEFAQANDNSVVVRLQVGSTSFLFTGDAEADAEQSMLNAGLNLRSNVLKVGHHGSRTATTQAFLNSVAPSYAVISAGKNNPYGHPHAETIQKLLAKGVTIYGTFQSGTIVASTDGTSITFQDSPQPIPEFEPAIFLSIFMTATLVAVITHRRNTPSRADGLEV